MVSQDAVQRRLQELKEDAESGSYFLNPDEEMVTDLVEGLLTNQERYGMELCPCRLMEGEPQDNLDIVCPCDYRDVDLAEKGACFCALYLTESNLKQGGPDRQVPDRRLQTKRQAIEKVNSLSQTVTEVFANQAEGDYPVWRCKVCGYLCANAYPPGQCPICKAKKERFEKMSIMLSKAK